MTEPDTSNTIINTYIEEIKNTPLEEWITKIIEDLSPEKLKNCIDEDTNPLQEYFYSDFLSFQPIREAIRMRLHQDWKTIEDYFLNPKTFKKTLMSRDDDYEAILKDNARFIDDMCWKTYRFLRELVYMERELIRNTLKKHKKVDTTELIRELVEGGSNVVNIPKEIFTQIIDELYADGEIAVTVEWQGEEEAEP